MAKNVKPYKEPTHDEIAAFAPAAFMKSEGRPQGKALDHWLKAEAQLIARAQGAGRASCRANKNTTKAAIEAASPSAVTELGRMAAAGQTDFAPELSGQGRHNRLPRDGFFHAR